MDKSKTPEQIQAQLKRLHEVVAHLLSPAGDDTSQKLLFFVKRLLYQFNIKNQFHESEIVVEAYLRTRKRIEQGEVIENIPAWLNQVSFNIIREYSRKVNQSRTLTAHLRCAAWTSANHPSSEFPDSQPIEALLAALAQLQPEDEELLILRIVKGFSWQEISQYLEAKDAGCKKYSAQTLRKRGERALTRLKQKFFSVDSVDRT
jgi:DNA-directed RNA polymerase specialized sigma24 family protein